MIIEHPAGTRNRAPILAELRRFVVAGECVLEVASGPGQHIELFAQSLPQVYWQPSELDARLRASISARIAAADLDNVAEPLSLDVCGQWPAGPFYLVFVCNLLHIAPWQANLALFAGAAKVLRPGGKLFVYGPFSRDGAHTSAGNAAFDLELQARGVGSGIRALEDVQAAAAEQGLACIEVIDMPANNLSVVFEARQPLR